MHRVRRPARFASALQFVPKLALAAAVSISLLGCQRSPNPDPAPESKSTSKSDPKSDSKPDEKRRLLSGVTLEVKVNPADPKEGTPDVAPGETADDKPESRPAVPKATFAFLPNNDAEFWVFAQRGVEKYAKDSGEVCAVLTTKAADAKEQKGFIEDLVKVGVKGLAICPKDARTMGEFLAEINQKVPVVLVDIDVEDPKARRAFLGTDNYLAGRAAGELVQQAAPEGGKVALFVGRADAASAVERRQGVLDQLAGLDRKTMGPVTPADAAGLKVGKHVLVKTLLDNGQKDETERLCEELLTASPDIDVVVGLWAYNAPALVRAVTKSNRPAKIVGFDEDDETLAGIQDGKVVGTVVKDPFELGYQSMKLLRDLAAGDAKAVEKAIAKSTGSSAANRIDLPSIVVGPRNVAEFRAKYQDMLRNR